MKSSAAGPVRFPAWNAQECYVLLCRHGPHRNGRLVSGEEKAGTLPVQAVAEKLHEQLLYGSPRGNPPIRLRQVIYAPRPEDRQTTAVLARQLGTIIESPGAEPLLVLADQVPHQGAGTGVGRANEGVPLRECRLLDPQEFSKPGDDIRLAGWLRQVAAGQDPPPPGGAPGELWAGPSRPDGNAVLVVGHQPHLGWLTDTLLRPPGRWWRFRSFAVPFSRAELVCLAFPPARQIAGRQLSRYGQGHVLWTIAPDDRKAADQVRDKIRSKMETAKLLSGVITFALGALLAVLLDPGKWKTVTAPGVIQLAAGLLLAALVLFLATMYAYDRLLMPDRFWGEQRPRPDAPPQRRGHWLVQRPPSSTAWVLYVNMMRVWRGLFTPATACVVIALALLSSVVLHLGWIPMVAIVLPASAILALLVFWFRPILGSED
jgi:hypothetical protein